MSDLRRPKGLDEGSHLIRAFYRCTCGNHWEDVWDSACDDECAACGLTISPYDDEDVVDCDCDECVAESAEASS